MLTKKPDDIWVTESINVQLWLLLDRVVGEDLSNVTFDLTWKTSQLWVNYVENWGKSILGREISSTQFESGKELSIFENLKVACVNGA